MKTRVRLGDCLEVLKDYDENTFDSIVTDPPYGISFMGKKWDYDVPSVAIWEECLRVLKPGGHLLAFAGTRTQHRMCCNIEDAGFQIENMVLWVYGQGFPKSRDIGKAIDKINGETGRELKFTKWMRSTGVVCQKITEVLRALDLISKNGTMAGHFYATSLAGQPAIPTRAIFNGMRPLLGEIPPWVETLIDRIEAERQVTGPTRIDKGNRNVSIIGNIGPTEFTPTAPATEEAKQWDGWGSALKPALEPITLARKPLSEKTIAANVLRWGTGGLNIGACKIKVNRANEREYDKEPSHKTLYADAGEILARNKNKTISVKHLDGGRWPANLILTYPEDSYILRDDVAPEQLRNLARWMDENPEL